MRTGRVRKLRFSVLKDDVLKKMSVTHKVLDHQLNPIPEGLTVEVASAQKTYGSVVDPRMGTDHVGHVCETCHKKCDPGDHFDCPGHFGHIELACPQLWPLFATELTGWLENVCPFCSKRNAKIHIRKDKHTTRLNACDDEENLFEDIDGDVDADEPEEVEDEMEEEEAPADEEEEVADEEEVVDEEVDEEDEEAAPESEVDADELDDVSVLEDEDVSELAEDEEVDDELLDDLEDEVDEEAELAAATAAALVEQQRTQLGSKFFRCNCFPASANVRFKYYVRKNQTDKAANDSGQHVEVRVTAKRTTTTGRTGKTDVTTRFIVPNHVIMRILSQINPADWRYMYHEKYREYRASNPMGAKAPPPYRPVDLMIRNVPILPTVDRPGKVVVDSKKQADLITRQYNQIVARNNWLKQHLQQLSTPNEKPGRKKKATESAPENEFDPTGRTLVQHMGGLYGIDSKLTMLCQEFLTLEGVPVGKLATRANTDTFRGERSLASAVAAVVDKTNKPGVTSRNLAQRFQGKEGRLRGNLAGKRVDFSARTVITPGTNLDVDEIGIPYSFARSLTVPVKVTDFNLEHARALMRNSNVRLVELPNRTRIWCDEKMKPEVLERNARDLVVGSTVHRFLQDGDIVIMNRQPTLHKPSMQGHRVKIHAKQQTNVRYLFGGVVNRRPQVGPNEAKGARKACMNGFDTCADNLTLQLNLSVTRPYNADFDGDEMNLHVPQTLPAQVEVRELMAVEHQLGSRFIGIVQDTLMGAYLMSSPDTFLSEEFASWIWMSAKGRRPDLPEMPAPAILKPKRMWTGRQLLNLVFHEVSLTFNPDADLFGKDTDLVMFQGEIVSGRIRKPHFGEGGYLFAVVFINYGSKKAGGVINNFQAIVNPYVLRRGISVGIKDCMPSDRTAAKLEEWRASVDERARAVDPTDEAAVQALTRQLKSEVSTIVIEGASSNRIRDMAIAGSKGSDNNLVQIQGALSQQIVMGHRPFGDERARVFPTDPFEGNEHSLTPRGFVRNSLLDGISPTEYFCHAAGGREGIIDTGIKTAEAGYATRKMACVTEGSVRNYKGGVDNQALLNSVMTAPLYGDGMDVSMLLKHNIDVHTRSDVDLRGVLKGLGDKSLELKLFSKLKQDRANVQKICVTRQDAGCDFWLPVDFRHIVTNSDVLPGPTVDAQTIYAQLFAKEFVVYRPNNTVHTRDLNERATELFKISLRNFMLRHFLKHKLPSKATFESWMEQISVRFDRSQVQAGEPVGLIATQSLMQTTMQATLNTFHTAGTGAGAAATGGLKYFNALISAQSPKISTTFIALKDAAYEWNVLDAVAPEVKMASLVSQVRELRGSLPNTRVRRLHPIDTVAVDFMMPTETLFKKRVMTMQVFEAVGKLVGHCFLELVTGGLRMYVPTSMYTRAVVNEVLDVIVTAPKVTPRGKDKNHRGIFGVRRTKVERVVRNSSGFLEKQTFPQIEVYGNFKLADIFMIPGVDAAKTHCNDIYEMQSALGLGAARSFLHKEIYSVVTGSGSNVNPRFVSQIVDYMVWSGAVKPVTRHGMQNFGPLQAAAFEMPVKVLANAALANKSDPMLSPTSNVIFGQEIRGIGTAIVDAVSIEMLPRTDHHATPMELVCDWFEDFSLAVPIPFDAPVSKPALVVANEFEMELECVPLAF